MIKIICLSLFLASPVMATYEIISSSMTAVEFSRVKKLSTGNLEVGVNNDGLGTTVIYWVEASTYTIPASPSATKWGN